MQLSEQLDDSQPSPLTDHLNTLLTDQIGYGPAQQKLSRSLYLLLFSQGCESIILGLLLPILTEQWLLSTFQQSMLITVVYSGVATGSYLQMYSDRFGRYSFIMYDTILQSIFGVVSCFCWSYGSFLVARFFYGVGIGICLPLSAAYITEISPGYMRATLLTKSRVYWSMGSVVTCFLAWFFLAQTQNSSASWRTLLFLICLPSFYALYEHRTHGRQSLRYLWVQKQTKELISLVNYMCKLNDRPEIDASYILALMNSESSQGKENGKDVPVGEMLNEKYKPFTVRLVVSWFAVCFIYYGIMLLLPTILHRVFQDGGGEGEGSISSSSHGETFKYLFLIAISLVQVAGFYLATSIMDHPSIGRKKGVFYGLFTVGLCSLLILLSGESNILLLFICLSAIKFIITATFMILYPYSAQVYETMIRGKALGVFSTFGRMATMLLGVVGVYAIDWWGGSGLYLLFFGLSAVASYSAWTMPYCTGNRPIS